MDFFEHQHQAKKKTKVLVFYFLLAVTLIISVINMVVFHLGNQTGQFQLSFKQYLTSPAFAFISLGVIGVIILGSLIRGFQIRGGGQAVAQMVNARPVNMNSKDRLERRLINVVEEMSIASGTPIPRLYIMDDEMGMNAFVAGLVPSDTVMVVTKGLLENLNRQELQGVVAHEYSHIFNSDMTLNVRLIAILGGILAIGQLGYFMLRSMRFSGSRRSSSSGNNQLGLVIFGGAVALLVVGYIGLFFGRLIKAAISRQREFLADASAVQYSRDSMGIANALYRIKTNGKGSLLDSSHAEDMSHMCFGNALKLKAFSGMLATHPPIDERIKTLVPGYKPPSSQRQTKQQTEETSAQSFTHETASSFTDTSTSGTSPTSTNKSQSSEDALEIISSKNLMDSAGKLVPEQLEQAEIIYRSIPEELIDAAHTDKMSDLVILSLILVSSAGEQNKLIGLIKERLSENQIKTITKLNSYTQKLSDELQLPLIELCIPTLKLQKRETKTNLLACASLLMEADHTINPFEFFLYALLRKNLSDKDAVFETGTYKKYKPVIQDIFYLLSLQVQANADTDSAMLNSVMKTFEPGWQDSKHLPEYDAAKLHKSLNRLNRLSPLLKRPLMESLVDLGLEDGKIQRSELELIRVTSIYLECPLPITLE